MAERRIEHASHCLHSLDPVRHAFAYILTLDTLVVCQAVGRMWPAAFLLAHGASQLEATGAGPWLFSFDGSGLFFCPMTIATEET